MVKRLDKDDFTRLVLQNQTAMFRAARAIVTTDEDAEDAVQNFALYLQDNTGRIADTGGKLLVSLAKSGLGGA